ncbi:MAG: hypothetical protein JWR63_2954 [Conexibacter sp.]|nr:hypothetical protein [Conexibacter sp.]
MRGAIVNFRGHLLVTIVAIVVAAGFLLGLAAMGGYFRGGDGFKLRALVPTTASMTDGSRVTMAGVTVGRVVGVRSEGYATLLSMEIDDARVLPLPADTRVTLRQRTPVGENYITLEKGDLPSTVDENTILPVGNASEYVDVDEVLSVLQGDTRLRTRQFIQEAGGALNTRGAALNMVLGRTSEIVQSAGSLFTRLEENREQTAALIRRLGRVSAAVGERGEAIRVTAERGVVAMNALRSRDDALRETLEALPSTLAQVQSTSATLKATSEVGAPVLRSLSSAMVGLRPAVRELRPAAAAGRNLASELGRSITPLDGTLRQLRRTAVPLSRALPPLRKAICQVSPMVEFLGPYTRDVIGFVAGFGSASNSYDSTSHVLRVPLVLGENSVVGLPDEVSKAQFTLLRSGLFLKGMPLTWDPYPAAGQADSNRASTAAGLLFGREDLRKSGYRYPRVQADC